MPNKEMFEEANAKWAKSYSLDKDIEGPKPSKQALVLTCMDARVIPEQFLGLKVGDCHVLRNGGGRVTPDVLRSITASQRMLGTKEVYLIHHTDCGFTHFTNEEIRPKIKEELGERASAQAEQIDFLPFKDPEHSLREDIDALKASPLMPPEILVYSYVYDVATGQLKEVL